MRLLTGLTVVLLTVPLLAKERTEPVKDRIDAPATGTGLCVHNAFQSNMVIQRDKPIRVWGWAKPDDVVTVSFAGKQGSATTTKEGTWSVTLPSMPAKPAPQQMVIKGKAEAVTLDNILLGDIWVLGGQSNMQHPLSRVEEGTVEIASANFPRPLKSPWVFTAHDAIDRARILQTKLAGHAGNIGRVGQVVKGKWGHFNGLTPLPIFASILLEAPDIAEALGYAAWRVEEQEIALAS